MKDVVPPKSMRPHNIDIDHRTPRSKGVKKPDRIGLENAKLSDVESLGSLDCVLGNATLSERDFARKNRKTVQDDAPVRLRDGLNLIL